MVFDGTNDSAVPQVRSPRKKRLKRSLLEVGKWITILPRPRKASAWSDPRWW